MMTNVFRPTTRPAATRPQALNPNGIPSLSPGLRGTNYPGFGSHTGFNPERVAARPASFVSHGDFEPVPQPFQGWGIFADGAPRVARASQPWADGSNPFRIEEPRPTNQSRADLSVRSQKENFV